MSRGLLFGRWLALVSLAIWFGGFTFYSAVVVPVVTDVMGKVEAGSMVTREVTITLNAIGVATLAVWWGLVAWERRLGRPWMRRVRYACLAINSGLLGWMYLIHATLSRQLESAAMEGFYARHEFYLILSTIQWGACLVLMAASLAVWSSPSQSPAGDR